MNHVFGKPFFWLLFIIISSGCGFFAFKYFSTAFPIVNLQLDMSRTQALEKATLLAKQFHFGPEGYSQAASFESDDKVQTFVELEAGGKKAFVQMLEDQFYSPFTWKVRHFKEFEKNETIFSFKPDGTPYGFIQTISENDKGAALEVEQAHLIAQKSATQDWGVKLNEFTKIEESKEVVSSGRIDYTFTYERPDIRIGQGYYRLKLVVSGDKLTELTHLVKVPESFTLRYKEMRAANKSVAIGAQMAWMILYFLGGCVVGLFLLARRGLIIWKTPLIWSTIIALLHVLVGFNQLPLFWMHYNTALSMQGFLLKFIISLLMQFLYMIIFYGLAFMAAESLTRVAFSYQPLLWNVWSKSAGSSYEIVGRTIGSYLMVPVYVAFGIAFYIITTKFFGWWSPSSALINPNILAAYFPWLSPLVLSLGASFMEECLFRAVPLAGAMIIGKKFGNTRIWLIIGFIVQIIIFGAAHADYPAQPAYARVIELIYFSLISGLIYIRFGLLPVIISHFTYDVVWFSLPLFVSTASFSWINQFIVILVTSIPLLMICKARWKNGSWHELNENNFNHAWHPKKPVTETEIKPIIQDIVIIFTKKTKIILLALGIVGIGFWLGTKQFKQDANPIILHRAEIINIARKELNKRDIMLNPSWTLLSSVSGNYTNYIDNQLEHEFIWQLGGKKLYQKLLGNYLTPPRWTARYATWKGPVDQRAQEYQMSIIDKGTIFRFKHQLPEHNAGQHVAEQQARIIAHQAVQSIYNIDPLTLQEISAVATKRPERKDWTFIFNNKKDYPLEQGQLRIAIEIAGDEVIDSHRYIHVPENWQRTQHNKKNIIKNIATISLLLIYILFSLCLVAALRKSSIYLLFSKTFIIYGLALAVIYFANLANMWPVIKATFNTSEPFYNQAFMVIGLLSVGAIFRSGALSLVISQIMSWKKPYQTLTYSISILSGICIGAFVSGIFSLFQKLAPSIKPLWADYAQLPTYIPWLGIIIETVSTYIGLTTLLLLLCIIMDNIQHSWPNGKKISAMLFMIFGILIIDLNNIEDISFWICFGIVMGLVLLMMYNLAARYDNTIIPIAVSIFVISQSIQQAVFNAYPGAFIGNIMACLTISLLAMVWSKAIWNTHSKR